ncbi:hypothetical protein NC651_019374 [Populus alba x Populus x berolinensis]|nr:hypothetical protein NC651_019374 [Populus alba x Populus x berolinensis]
MARQATTLFLEEWLRISSGSSSNTSADQSSSSSARAIIQAWAELRDCHQHQSFEPHHFQSLKILLDARTSLHVAEPQAKLLVSILSSTNLVIPLEAYPLLLRLLYIWNSSRKWTTYGSRMKCRPPAFCFTCGLFRLALNVCPDLVFLITIAIRYMGHPNGKVARASHSNSMFAAFISSGKDSNENERSLLKEQLVFYYMQRSLAGFPGITPFEGMASGVAALVRNLPAGSPATFYCIHSLVEKASKLCADIATQKGGLMTTSLDGKAVESKNCSCVGFLCSSLPDDMLVEILYRITDRKHLIRLKSVCKYWNNLITDVCVPKISDSSPFRGFIYHALRVSSRETYIDYIPCAMTPANAPEPHEFVKSSLEFKTHAKDLNL